MTAAAQTTTSSTQRGWFATVMAILLAILALSDLTKTLQHMRDPHLGLVIFGVQITSIVGNLVMGLLFGIFLLAYAFGLWGMRRWVIPISLVYAFYVPVNLVLFWFLHVFPRPSVGFIVIYLAISLTGSIGTGLYVAWNRHQFA
jgi:hypothetical protein